MNLTPTQVKILYLRYDVRCTKGEIKRFLDIRRNLVNDVTNVGRASWTSYKRKNLTDIYQQCANLDAQVFKWRSDYEIRH